MAAALRVPDNSFPKEEWIIPADADLNKLRPVVIWEYSRESTILRSLSEELKKTLAFFPATTPMDRAEMTRLIREARLCGYRYADFIYAGRDRQSHDWHKQFFGLVQRLDAIMPDTEWRFLESPDFPSAPWWLRPQEKDRIDPHPRTFGPARSKAVLSRGALVYARSLELDGESFIANADFLPGDYSSPALADGIEITAAIVVMPLVWVRKDPVKAIDHAVEWILTQGERIKI